MQASPRSEKRVQTSTWTLHMDALNEPETCPPSENVRSALPVTLEPTELIVMVPDAAKAALGAAVQASVFAANASAMVKFPCESGAGIDEVIV